MQVILGMFSKSKHVHKQKRGVSKSIFLERHGEPVAGGDVSGIYEVDGLELLTLRLTQSGGEGTDRDGTFVLREVRRNGALLTATKVYPDGRTKTLEGVFMDLVTRAGKTPEDATTTRMRGFGAVLDEPYAAAGGVFMDRVFFARR